MLYFRKKVHLLKTHESLSLLLQLSTKFAKNIQAISKLYYCREYANTSGGKRAGYRKLHRQNVVEVSSKKNLSSYGGQRKTKEKKISVKYRFQSRKTEVKSVHTEHSIIRMTFSTRRLKCVFWQHFTCFSFLCEFNSCEEQWVNLWGKSL